MTISQRAWGRDERLVVLRYYPRTPYGRLNARNPEIIELAARLGRTPGAIAMRASNFANLDPELRARGRVGLPGVSRADRDLWREMTGDWSGFAAASALAAQALGITEESGDEASLPPPDSPTEQSVVTTARLVQRSFRQMVLAAYEDTCAISGLAVPELLNASHIIPWAKDEARRADPTNGLALNALYDRAFDRGLISISAQGRVLVSPRLKRQGVSEFHQAALIAIERREVKRPARFTPDPIALEYHREVVFIA